MKIVDISEAKKYLSHLVERAAVGEGGKPLVKVLSLSESDTPKKRRIGFMDGQIKVPDDFDTMMAQEIEEMFYGSDRFLP